MERLVAAKARRYVGLHKPVATAILGKDEAEGETDQSMTNNCRKSIRMKLFLGCEQIFSYVSKLVGSDIGFQIARFLRIESKSRHVKPRDHDLLCTLLTKSHLVCCSSRINTSAMAGVRRASTSRDRRIMERRMIESKEQRNRKRKWNEPPE